MSVREKVSVSVRERVREREEEGEGEGEEEGFKQFFKLLRAKATDKQKSELDVTRHVVVSSSELV